MKANRDVQSLAKEIVHWVGEIKSAFEHEGGHFTSKTRKNMATMRYVSDCPCAHRMYSWKFRIFSTLIEEICRWATARLVQITPFCFLLFLNILFYAQEDGRWSRLKHGLSVEKEIDEFKSRINRARAIFMVTLTYFIAKFVLNTVLFCRTSR